LVAYYSIDIFIIFVKTVITKFVIDPQKYEGEDRKPYGEAQQIYE
jgi:hypothetical protein